MKTRPVEAQVIGSAQDGGVPQVGCGCPNCRRAQDAAGLVRWPSGLAVTVPPPTSGVPATRLLVDAGPELRSQLRRFPGPVDAVLLTHLHMGHYPGILEFGREVSGRSGLEVWCSEAVAGVLAANAPWAQLSSQGHVVYRRFEFGRPFAPLSGLSVTAYPVPHRNELGDTAGFALRTQDAVDGGLLYLPDADRWNGLEPDLCQLVAGVDRALLDGTFYDRGELTGTAGREAGDVPHPPVRDTLILLGALASRVSFIHLNHTNPLLDPDSPATAWLRQCGAAIAVEGQKYPVGRI